MSLYGIQPGIAAANETAERNILWGRREQMVEEGVVIGSAAVDSGNTPTTQLRAGLILGKKDSDGLYYAYDPDATDGTQFAEGVLLEGLNMLDPSGTAVARTASILVGGRLRAAGLVNVDAQARAQMTATGRFIFDDDVPCAAGFLLRPRQVAPKATHYTVVAADNGTLFLATAAANFTLPAPAVGLSFMFAQTADADMAILSAGSADDIVHKGDAAADSVTFNTAGQKIGSCAIATAVYTAAGTLKWLVLNLGGTTATVA
jgi:hypothetical protein